MIKYLNRRINRRSENPMKSSNFSACISLNTI